MKSATKKQNPSEASLANPNEQSANLSEGAEQTNNSNEQSIENDFGQPVAVESLAAEPKTSAEASTETIATADEQPIKESELGSQELSSAGSLVDNAATCEAGAESAISEAADSHDFLTQVRAKYPQAKPIHPIAQLTPPYSPEQFQKLVEDIKQHGQVNPILTLNGEILDGRHRELACFEAGVEPNYQEWTEDRDPAVLKASLELRRRHLSPSQRAALAATLLLAREKGEAKQAEFAPVRKARTRTKDKETLADAWGVSHRMVDYALKAAKEAPEELEQVQAGKKKLKKMTKELKSKEKALESEGQPVVEVEAAPIDVAAGVDQPSNPSTSNCEASPALAMPPQSPVDKFVATWPGLTELLKQADELLNDPWPNGNQTDHEEDFRVTAEYIRVIKAVLNKFDGYRKQLIKKQTRLLEYQEQFLGDVTQLPPVDNENKQPSSQKPYDQDGPPEPEDVGGA